MTSATRYSTGTYAVVSASYRGGSGTAPAAPPTARSFWGASAVGAGTRTLNWTPQTGNWRIVLMNAGGARGVSADVSIGARLPHLLAISIAGLGAGIVLLLLASGGIYPVIRERASVASHSQSQ